jgi:hypothetical protein
VSLSYEQNIELSSLVSGSGCIMNYVCDYKWMKKKLGIDMFPVFGVCGQL